MDDNLLRYFIFVTGFAVILQALVMVALYLAVSKSSAKIEALATEVRAKALPAIDSVQSLVVDLRPKIDTISVNVAESTNLVRNQLARIDATLTDALDRTRLQVIRADELLNRTMDKVEDTTEMVHKTVVSPLRQVNGLMTAITTGLEVFLGQKRRHPKNGGSGVPQDEMFI
jgi:outer membrane murein-binding lipoprotein Lpp